MCFKIRYACSPVFLRIVVVFVCRPKGKNVDVKTVGQDEESGIG